MSAPERLRHFELIEKIGQGGFATVWRARDTRLGREVAIKRLRPEILVDPAVRQRVVQEARAIARLSHPRIVTLHDILTLRTEVVLVMELVSGETLAARLARGPLPPDEVARMGRSLAQALAHAHERGVVHRDLKPSNILLSGDGRIKVTDFGLARFVPEILADHAASLGAAPGESGLVGTPAYMSPEQVRGLPADARSDVFSLCVVLFEAARGERPFAGKTFFDLANAILYAEPAWKSDGTTLAAALAAVVRRGLAKEPSARYPDMLALAADLDGVLALPRQDAAPAPAAESRIVGRKSEIAHLRSVLDEARAPGGGGRTIVISGEAGIGKTTLLEEFLRLPAGARPLPVGRAAFREGRQGFRPIAEALGRVLGAAAPPVARDLQESLAEAFRDGADGRGGRPFPQLLDEALASLAETGPFVLALENVHDANPDAIAALRVAVSAVPATRGLLLLTYRTEEKLASGAVALRGFLLWARGERLAEEMALPRFAPAETAELLARLLPPGRGPEDWLLRRVHAETEGNPLFIRETVRSLVRAPGVAEEDGLGAGRSPIPGQIRDVLLRRLAALEPELRQVLEAASIEGEVFRTDTVAALLGADRRDVLGRLARLVRDHELVVPAAQEYRFAHGRIREILVEGLLPEVRQALHGRLAEWLARNLPASAGEIARHLVAAERRAEALPHLIAAGRRAFALAATDEARWLYAEAAATLETLGPVATRRHLDVLNDLARLQRLAGARDAARRLIERVVRHAGDDTRARGMAVHERGWLDLRDGRLGAARRGFTRALACFERARDRVWAAACHDALGVALRHEGRLREALREARRGLAQRERLRYAWGVALSESNLAAIHLALGDPAKALERAERACRYFRSHGQGLEAKQNLAGSVSNVGILCAQLGRIERAIEAHAEAIEVRRGIGDRTMEPVSLVNLAAAQALAGLLGAAADGFERAARAAAAAGNRAFRSHALRGLALVRRREGNATAALALLEEALVEARAARDVEAEREFAVDLASVRVDAGRLAEARASLGAVTRHARKGGLGQLLARVRHVEGRLEEARGRRPQAAIAYRRALAALRDRPEPELAWRARSDLGRLLAARPVTCAEGRRLLADARRRVSALAGSIADPVLRISYASDPERSALLGKASLPVDLSNAPTPA